MLVFFRTHSYKFAFLFVWVATLSLSYYLYAYPQDVRDTREVAGVVTRISATELTVDVSNSAFFFNNDHSNTKFYRFALDRNTLFMLETYVVVDDVIVSNTGIPKINITDVYPGDAVYVQYNDASGVAEKILVGDPVLWY